jgi:hypothetical protein
VAGGVMLRGRRLGQTFACRSWGGFAVRVAAGGVAVWARWARWAAVEGGDTAGLQSEIVE